MWDLNDVTSIEYRHGYVYHVVFDDGLEGEVDFSEFIGLGPVFEALKDEAFFRMARIEGGTISWPNGADVAPETLYEKLRSANTAIQASARTRAQRILN
jgi:hypothetical protein